MQKFLIVLSVVLLVGTLAFAAEAGKLTVWCSEVQVDILSALGSEFEAQYGIPVDVQEVPFGDIRSKFVTAAPAGEGPDIIVGAHDWTGELAANGLLVPMDFLTLTDRAEFMETSLKGFEYGGKLYGMPYAIEAIALMYNKDYLPEPPETMDELIAFAQEMTDDEFRGFIYNSGDFYMSAPFLFAAGGYVFKDTGAGLDENDIGLANEGAILGASLIKEMYDLGVLKRGDNYQIMDGLFKDGMAAAIINGPWAVKDIREAGIDYGIAPIPSIDGHPAKPFTGIQGFMINSKSPNTLFAIDFLANFINTKEVMYQIYLADPRIPTRLDVLEIVEDDPDVVAFFESASKGIPMPNIPAMNSVWSAAAGALTQIINDQLTPEEALQEAVAKIRLALEQ
ncbi:MAG TPA: maltose/maltodextrin ABC transporter substrate-binding protein MalE [Thermotogota bacterium]|nr:maltose/maltodextrin ABC transporter substrate-binding protein MalE [Thermotogota bacterium]HRW92047.1 maltose/maltodextrin ABC transporter substrate-binding protein MalE [Thermotogota bacterium]